MAEVNPEKYKSNSYRSKAEAEEKKLMKSNKRFGKNPSENHRREA